MSNHTVPRDFLRKIKLFEGCSPKELDRIDQLSDTLDVTTGTVLAQEGKVGKEFAVIMSGSATISRDGKPVTVNIPRRCMHCVHPPCAELCPWGSAVRHVLRARSGSIAGA